MMDCISCDGKIKDQEDMNEVSINYYIYCDTEAGDATIAVCDDCAKDALEDNKHTVLELIASTKIFRLKNPEAVLTPVKKRGRPKKVEEQPTEPTPEEDIQEEE